MSTQDVLAPPPHALRRTRTPAAALARASDGERLALAITAAAVAMLPLLSPGGPANTAPEDLIIALALGAVLLWAGASGRHLRFPYALGMAVFMAGGALAALAGPVPSGGLVAVVQDAVLLAWCWAVANVGSTAERLGVLMRAWAYAAIAWVLVLFAGLFGGVHAITGETSREGSRTALLFHDPNYAASYWFLSIMIIWATGRPRRRPVRIAAYVLLAAALLTTGSNSGIVSLIVGTAVAATVGIYRHHGATAAIAAAGLMLLAGSALAANVSLTAIQRSAHGSRYAIIRDGVGRGQTSVAQRGMLLRESVRLYDSGGLLGQGPTSTKVRLRRSQAPFVKEAHDDYFAALLERGFVGLIGLFLLVGSVATRVASLAGCRLRADFASVVVRPNAIVGAVAGALVAGAVYELLHVRHLWTLFAFVAALAIWGRE